MIVINIVLQILLLVMGIFLVVAVLLQKGNSKGLSGTVAGGNDTFYAKDQGAKANKWLRRLTPIVGVVFVVLVIVVYVIQPDYSSSTYASTDIWRSWSSYADIFKETK